MNWEKKKKKNVNVAVVIPESSPKSARAFNLIWEIILKKFINVDAIT